MKKTKIFLRKIQIKTKPMVIMKPLYKKHQISMKCPRVFIAMSEF